MKTKIADFWHEKDALSVQCELCPHNCIIKNGLKGICGVRENRNGTLFALNYFVASSSGIDPIEKKPLYHFYPGSSILSLGSFGCNFSCKFCQNYTISKEFSAFALGLKNVFVTNGFINPGPLDKFLTFADAFNIDLKAITDDFYRKQCGGKIHPVLETIKTVSKIAHLELTTLVIPTLNDSTDDFIKLRDWIADEVGENVPVHLSRYYPMYKLSIPPTPVETLYKARDTPLSVNQLIII